MVSEEMAEKILSILTPKTTVQVNDFTITVGDAMDLERHGTDERYWFYSDNDGHAVYLDLSRSESSFEIALLKKSVLWFGIMKEESIPLERLTLPDHDFVVFQKTP